MEIARYKQLHKVLQNAKDITGIQFVVFSFFNEASFEFEIKIIEGVAVSKIQTAKKIVQGFIKDFDLNKFGFSPDINPYVEKIVADKKYLSADIHAATENVFPPKVLNALFKLIPEMEVTTFPVVIDDKVMGLMCYVSEQKLEAGNLKSIKAFSKHLQLFIENILVNERLIEEIKEKTASLEVQKNYLEENVRERTLKLDNSRSALLYMLKDIDKASKKLSSAKEYTDNIIRSMIETLVVADTHGIIQKVNKATSDLLGFSEAELIGRHLSFLFPEREKANIDQLITEFVEKESIINIEKTYRTKDGIEIPVIFSGSVMKEADNVIQGIVCVASDITIRKQHEREVQEHNKQIARTNLELKEALRKAEESDKLKTAFLQNMSHEIRTPLNGIVGFSQLLSSKDYPEANKIEIAKLVERSSYRLIELVNNILDIAKIETGQVNINNTAFMLNAFMNEQVNFFSLFAKEKNLGLYCENALTDDDSIIFQDKEKLHQIMVNLISNAIKFTTQGEIRFGYAIVAGKIEFYVKDTGVGIPAELQEKVFDRFVQADIALTRNYEGSGLGLSICKGLTELLGGEMWLKSEMGKQTTFYFTLPFNPANINKQKQETTLIDLEAIPRNLKILVAEDDEINYKFLNYLFLHSKHSITRATNGQEAVDMFVRRDDFDLVLMDLKMPVMSGYDATRVLKSKFPDVPVIAITAYAFEEDRQKALAAGCDDFIQKAYKKETLFEKILKHIEAA